MAGNKTSPNKPSAGKRKQHDSVQMHKYIEWQNRYGTEKLRHVYAEALIPSSGEMIWMGRIKKASFLDAVDVLQTAGLLDENLNPTESFQIILEERRRQIAEQSAWRQQ